MKNIFLFLFIILITIPVYSLKMDSGLKTDSSYSGQPGDTKLSKYFYKRLEGSINNNLNIVMNIIRCDTVLYGDYYCETTGIPVFFTFNSRIDADGSIFISEDSGQINSSSMSGLSGEIKGRFVSEHAIMGTWQKPNAPAAYYFTLIEKYPAGSVNLEIKEYGQNYDNGNGKRAAINFNLVQINNGLNKIIEDSINYNITHSFIKIYKQDDSTSGLINPDEVINDYISRYKEFINDTSMAPEFKQSWETSYKTSVLFNSNNILATENTEFLFEGGAHPLTYFIYENYNLQSGRKVILDDLFKPNYKATLDKIGERKFKEARKIKLSENLNAKGYLLEKDEFHLNTNFSISKLGLIFRFNEYEIGPYVFGAPEVFIPYSDLRYLIKPDGLLAQFIK